MEILVNRYHDSVRVLRAHQHGAGRDDPARLVQFENGGVYLRLLDDRLGGAGVGGVYAGALLRRDNVLVDAGRERL
jgi:hypothetical protein